MQDLTNLPAKQFCKVVSEEITTALQTLFEDEPFQIDRGNARYDDGGFTLQIKVARVVDGVAQTPERQDFERYAKSYQLEPGDLDAEFTDGPTGERYQITGAKPRARKYPILVTRLSDGARYKFPARRVVQGLGREWDNDPFRY